MRAIILFTALAFLTSTGEGFGEEMNISECSSNFGALERALLQTRNNKFELLRAFYPPRQAPSTFVTVNYAFLDEDGNNTVCTKTWFWSTVGFHLIQPPSIYMFTSLLFNPEQRIGNTTLYLPHECRGLVAWNQNGGCICHTNGMLDVLTERLKSYDDYSERNNDDPTHALAICEDHRENEFNASTKVVTFLSCGLVVPVIFIIILAMLLRSVRGPIRVAITTPQNHANLAALALTGLIFTVFVLIMDICAVTFTAIEHHEYAKHDSIDKEYSLLFVILTAILDAIPTLFSLVVLSYLRMLACPCECTKNISCLESCFESFLYPIFGIIVETETKRTEEEKKRWKEFKNNEFVLWIVAGLCVAPLFCIASHSGYIIIGWVSNVEHATSILFMYIFSFLYYFIIFRQLHLVFLGSDPTCPETHLFVILLKKLGSWCCITSNCFIFCPCRCFSGCTADGNGSDSDSHSNSGKGSGGFCHSAPDQYKQECFEKCRISCIKCFTCLKCFNKCTCTKYEKELERVDKGYEMEYPRSEIKKRDKKCSENTTFNLSALFMELYIGFPLVGLEVFVIAAFITIPVLVDTAASHIYRIVQLVFIIATGLITYKLFHTGEVPKQILRAFISNFKKSDARDIDDAEAAGEVISMVAHTVINMHSDGDGSGDGSGDGNGHGSGDGSGDGSDDVSGDGSGEIPKHK